MSAQQNERTGFTVPALLASVAAWMDEHPLTAAAVVDSVNIKSGPDVGSNVLVYVRGDVVELGIMADALGVERDDVQPMRDCHSETYGERWWRQGSIMTTRPNGEHWTVYVTRELSAVEYGAPVVE